MTQLGELKRRPVFGGSATALALWVASACGHSEPFGSRTFDTDQPFDPTPPIQLTLNRGADRRPAWMPDGSAIVYATQGVATRDDDVCLATLPPTGGRQRSLICDLSPNAPNLTEVIESAAPAADGRLAFYTATSPIGFLTPESQSLSLGSVADPATRVSLLTIPYTVPGHQTHGGVSQIRWQSPNRLLYLGEAVFLFSPCNGCALDTLRSGIEAVSLSIESGAAPQPIPETDNATGVSPGSTEDEIYYTIGGDSRVYRRTLSTGEVSVAFDFGGLGIARDVHVVGNRMAAVVGGRVHFVLDPIFGPTQWDSGGVLHVVNFQDGSDVALQDPADLGLYRRPQLSPSGSELVAERYPLVLLPIMDENGVVIGVDTLAVRIGDLYRFGQP
jgi:hypothetical protein